MNAVMIAGMIAISRPGMRMSYAPDTSFPFHASNVYLRGQPPPAPVLGSK